ncbi:protein of unknown function [Bradyrhizobium vignae]|uniref:Uncharacterized protein n=1 Tax=Bradyrhizobium vignae TaxID=1549949 RepID=A0A2U3PY47_9BRAD|nr:protein of unknown function [Bradyrhizobium vignae]
MREAMPGLAECQSLLRLLIARGDPKAIRSAKGVIDQFLNTARRRPAPVGTACACSSATHSTSTMSQSACSARSPRSSASLRRSEGVLRSHARDH